MSDAWTIVHTERAASISDLEQLMAAHACELGRVHSLLPLSANASHDGCRRRIADRVASDLARMHDRSTITTAAFSRRLPGRRAMGRSRRAGPPRRADTSTLERIPHMAWYAVMHFDDVLRSSQGEVPTSGSPTSSLRHE